MKSLFLYNYTDVAAKKKRLDEVTLGLKAQFVGLDYIIDDVMNVISAWYIFPKAQLRPCIINLWGLTGSGKTALVNSIVELLDHRKFYAHFDMGEFQSESAKWIKRTFTEDLMHFNNAQAIICFDEFQFARTVKGDDEIRDDKLRVVWEMLDSGKINYIPDTNQYYVARAEFCISKLKFLKSQGGEIQNGEVISNTELFLKLFGSFFFDRDDRHEEKLDVNYLKSRDFIDGLMVLDDSRTAREQVIEQIRTKNLESLISYMTDLTKNAVTPQQLDLRASLIFVLGNLDEAFTMSSDLDPDMNADDVHELTKHITVAEIKKALQSRFRSEQIARLGNNHFIYRAFSSQQFREIIQRELDRISLFTKRELGWKLIFKDSLIDVIYSEGVIAVQGTRPVFTTINNLIQSRIGRLAMYVSEVEQSIASISWSHRDGKFLYDLQDDNGLVIKVVKEEVQLLLAKQRASADPHLQAHTAVHESGHAILATLLFRILPSVAVSRSASHDASGFCRVRFPKGPMTRDSLMMDIAVTLGGLAAEKIVFGKEFTSAGASSDISEASRLANNAIRRFGMGGDPIRLSVVSNYPNQDYFVDTSVYEEEAIKLVRDCMSVSEAILNRNKLLLLKMSEYLTSNSRIEKEMIGNFVKTYSTEEWVNDQEFIEPENYYEFDKILATQLRDLEKAQSSVDQLVCESLGNN